MKRTKKQKRIILNRIITVGASAIFSYILLMNNSIDFFNKFGIGMNKNLIAILGFFLVFFWVAWKSSIGEL